MHFFLNPRTAARVRPSRSLHQWQTHGRRALDEIESAHAAAGGSGRGRRTATQQINQAYAVLLASQFQRFCRDLHTQCVEHLVAESSKTKRFGLLLRSRFLEGRRLDAGNANPGNIGSDFARLGIQFWSEVRRRHTRNKRRQHNLLELNTWRNAVAHQDFTSADLRGRTDVRLSDLRRWRATCEQLAVEFDRVLHAYLHASTGTPPW